MPQLVRYSLRLYSIFVYKLIQSNFVHNKWHLFYQNIIVMRMSQILISPIFLLLMEKIYDHK